jgi:integrase
MERRLRGRLAVLHQGPRTPAAALEVKDISMVLLGLHTGLSQSSMDRLRLGQQLRDQRGRFVIHLEAAETKSGRQVDIPLPPAITSMLRTYIDTWRPMLVDVQAGEMDLWPPAGDDPQATPVDASIAQSILLLLRHASHWLSFGYLLGGRTRHLGEEGSRSATPRGPSRFHGRRSDPMTPSSTPSPEIPAAVPKRRPGRPSETYPAEQRAMPLPDWPRQDREAWQAAISRGDSLLDEAGPAAHLREVSQSNRAATWGKLLNFLELAGELDGAATPASRATQDSIRRWIAFLSRHQRASTVKRMLDELAMTAGAMMPKQDWSWIRRHNARPSARAVRLSRKPIETFDPRLLNQRLLERLAVLQDGPRGVLEAVEVRDLTMVRLGLYTSLRCANLTTLRLGQQIHDRDGQFMIYLDATETKTNTPMDVIVEPAVVPTLRVYIDEWRPILLRGQVMEAALWVTLHGNPTIPSTGRSIFPRVTQALIGRACNPHLTRHTMATEMLINDPTAVRTAGASLGHANSRSVNEVYDRSGSAGAHLYWKKLLAKQIRRGRDSDDEEAP